ncbi:MAG: DUF3857 domain-containing protein [Bacteroidales bacterium]
MRRALPLLLILLCSHLIALANENFSLKFGKVIPEELTLTSHPSDSTAEAMYIFRNCKMNYVYNDGFAIHYNIEIKVKVFNDAGKQYADITMPLYKNESVVNLSGTTYNLENGSVVKTKLDKQYIFEEEINKNLRKKKFSMPAVKAGSVFEYKYTLRSEDVSPHKWMMQFSIPLQSSEVIFIFPQYYIFNIETRGAQIKSNHSETTSTYHLVSTKGSATPHTCHAICGEYTAKDVPALKDEVPYLWYPDDYKVQTIFELRATQFPKSGYRPYASDWETIDNRLLESDYFGKFLNITNPYAEEIALLNLSEMSKMDKINIIFAFVKGRIKWNQQYRLGSESVRKAVKEGTGSNAEINFVLMAALRDAGIVTLPVAIRSRERGMLPTTIPTISSLNTFLLYTEEDGKGCYFDGSMDKCWMNALPPNLRVDRGRILSLDTKLTDKNHLLAQSLMLQNIKDRWVNLQVISEPSITYQMVANLSADHKVNVKCRSYHSDILGLSLWKDLANKKDSMAYIEKFEKDHNIKVSDYTYHVENTKVNSSFSFVKEVDMKTDSLIFINPHLLIHLSENRFKQEKRQLPVEYPVPITYNKTMMLTIPNGYEVESLPESLRLSMLDKGCECTYSIQHIGDQIILSYKYKENKIFFAQELYEEMKNYYGVLTDKNNQMIVLRKTNI